MLFTMFSSLLFGFSRSLVWAIVARAIAGSVNGNVGIIRTTVAELVPERELQPRAFSIMPLVWSIGSIFGPGFGGALANPAAKYPDLFGTSSFLKRYPFALPNIISSIVFLVGLTVGFLFLKETLETRKHQRDYGRTLGKMLVRLFARRESVKRQHDNEQTPLLFGQSRSASAPTLSDGDDERSHDKLGRQTPPKYREVSTEHDSLEHEKFLLVPKSCILCFAYQEVIREGLTAVPC